MTKQISRMMALIAAAGLVVGATGCKSVCQANKKAGLPMIVCQPLDQTVDKDGTAELKAKAIGKHLIYQWYRNGEPLEDTNGIWGANRSHLFVSHLSNGNVGNYSCRIISTDRWEFPVNTDTRLATVGFTEKMKLESQIITIQHQPLPPGSSGKSSCGPFCAYVLFNAGFTPNTGQNVAYLRVKFSNAANYLPVSAYNVLWQSGTVLDRGCATNYSDTQKSFPCNSAKKYKFIVYFTGNTWPLSGTAGAEVLLNIN
jgi:hypothetical protein